MAMRIGLWRAGHRAWLASLPMLIGLAAPAVAQLSDTTRPDNAAALTIAKVAPMPTVTPDVPGVTVRLGVSNFYQGLAAGSGKQTAQFSGKVDALVAANLTQLGFWEGLTLTSHGEYNFGRTVNNAGGTLLPVNTAATFPGVGGQSADLSSFYLSQRLGKTSTLSLGKINMLDQAANTPLRGGGGIDTFQNIGLAAPVTGLVPPYIFGAIGSIRTSIANFTLIVFDPVSAVRSAPDHLFESGVSALGSVTLPVAPFGLIGYQGVKLVGSTKKSVDLRDVPQLIVPRDRPQVFRSSRTPWFASYSFQQYLIQDEADPRRGWGIFGEVGVSDGNPTPIGRSVYVGLGGSSLFPGRDQDRFGVAYFRYALSDDVQTIFRPLGRIKAEAGAEAFYNAKITSWLNVGADLQVIGPALPGRQTAIVAGLRTRIGL